MKINYLEPIPAGLVVAEASVLRASRRSAYAEVDVWADGRRAARASTTYMIKPLTPR
jgi:acyl-coenzyme A thioesterase PaaI-like protein